MKKKPNGTVAAATTLISCPRCCLIFAFVVQWFIPHSACCFTEQKYIYYIFTNTTCVMGVMCLFRLRMGLSDRNEMGFVAKNSALDEIGLGLGFG